MKQKPAELSQRYFLALQKHLKQGSATSRLAALRLGKEGLALGLKPAELARIHERALTTLGPLSHKNGSLKRGGAFLTLATTPFKKTRRAGRGNKITSTGQNTRMHRQTTGKNARQQNGKSKGNGLEESLRRQKSLRRLTHLVLVAHEDERKKLSCGLDDEIAQTLLGINVRLLSLKEMARRNPTGLKKEIASTRRLVVKSARFMQRFARGLDLQRQTGMRRPTIGP